MDSEEFIGKLKKFNEKIAPFAIIAVLVLSGLNFYQLYKDNILKEEIAENCGWGEEDYYCWCEYSDVKMFDKLHIENNYSVEEIQNVKLVR